MTKRLFITGKLIKRKKDKNKKVSLSKLLVSKVLKNNSLEENKNTHHNVNKYHAERKESFEQKTKQVSTTQVKPKTRFYSTKIKNSHKKYRNAKQSSKSQRNKYQNLSKLIQKGFKKKKKTFKNDVLIRAFENQTDTVVRRCKMLAKKAENILANRSNKKTQKVFINETTKYSNLISNNKNISIRKSVKETIIHDYIPLKSSQEIHEMNLKTSNDLLKSVIELPDNSPYFPNFKTKPIIFKKYSTNKNTMKFPQLTFESHHYFDTTSHYNNNVRQTFDTKNDHLASAQDYQTRKTHYSRKDSQENLVQSTELRSTNDQSLIFPTKKEHKNKYVNNFDHEIKTWKKLSNKAAAFNFKDFSNDITSHTIDFSENSANVNSFPDNINNVNNERTFDIMNIDENLTTSIETTNIANIGFTYTITESNEISKSNVLELNEEHKMYTQGYLSRKLFIQESLDVISVSKLKASEIQENATTTTIKHKNVLNSKPLFLEEETITENIEPLNICEAIINSGDAIESTFDLNENLGNLNDTLFNFSPKNGTDILKASQKLLSNENVTNLNANHINEEMIKQIDIYTTIQDDIEIGNQNKNISEKKDNKQVTDILRNNFYIKNRLRFLPKGKYLDQRSIFWVI